MINQTPKIPKDMKKEKEKSQPLFPTGATQFHVKLIKKFNTKFWPVSV
jgi:hypothetical protein